MNDQNRLREFALKEKIEVKLEDLVRSLGSPRAILAGSAQGEPTKMGLFNSHLLILSRSLYWGSRYRLVPIDSFHHCAFKKGVLNIEIEGGSYILTDVDESEGRTFLKEFFKICPPSGQTAC